MAQALRTLSRSVPTAFSCSTPSLRQSPRSITYSSASASAVHRPPQNLLYRRRRALTTTAAAQASSDLEQMIDQKNSETPVVIYSKSYCPFSNQVKSFFKNSGVEFKAFELDQIEEGEDILDLLVDKSGSRTVPQIFVKGQYIGGCDDTMKKRSNGELQQIFDKAGIKASL